MPVIGMRLTVIPTFSYTWVKSRPRIPKISRLLNGVGGPAGRSGAGSGRAPGTAPGPPPPRRTPAPRPRSERRSRCAAPAGTPAASADPRCSRCRTSRPSRSRPATGSRGTRRPRVHLGVEEGQQPVLLVRGEPFPERQRDGAHGDVQEPDDQRVGDVGPPDEEQAGEEHHPGAPGQSLNASSRLSPGEASRKRSRGRTPAQNSMAKAIPMKTMALPRSGCLSTSRKGTPTIRPGTAGPAGSGAAPAGWTGSAPA